MLSILALASLTLSPQLPQEDPGSSVPAARDTGLTAHLWHDLDADGRKDLYVLAAGQDDVALRQLSDGSFVDVTEVLGLAGNRSVQILPRPSRADEFLLVGIDGGAKLMRKDAGGVFFETRQGVDTLKSVGSATWVDYDIDGREDLWALGLDGSLQLWRHGEDDRFGRVELDLAAGGFAPLDLPTTASAFADPAGGTTATSGGFPELESIGPILRTADRLIDQAGSTLEASTHPTLGMLYPLSSDFFIDHVGVGIGTTNPSAKLHVNGNGRMHELRLDATTGPPLEVSSTAKVSYLNVDMLDGLDASAFSQLGDTIEGSEIALDTINSTHIAPNSLTQNELAPNSVGLSELSANSIQSVDIIDGSILNADVSSGAAIAGTKIDPNFGAQVVTSTGGADFSDSSMFQGQSLVSTTGNTDDFRGHLGVLGSTDFEGVTSADWPAFEIGMAGIANDSGSSDNYGVMGHSNGTGVRGENSGAPGVDFGELGRSGIGVKGSGSLFAGQFLGDVTVVSDSDFNGSLGSGALFVRNTGNTRGLHFDDNEIGTDGGPLFLNADNLENTRINNLLHVKKDGKVGIGTSLPAEVLHVNGNVRCITLIQTSDARFKQDVQDIESAMQILRELRGVSYVWDREQLPEAGAGRQLGFLAQELRQVVPEAVVEAEDGTLAVSYSMLVPILVEALQEQEARFEERITRIEAALILAHSK